MKVGKSKVMVFERKEVEVVNFSNPYRVSVPVAGRCKVDFGRERMEEVKEFQNLGTALCKYGDMDGKTRERAVKVRNAIGSIARVMKGRNVSMEVKRGLRNSIFLPTLMYGSETWMWNRAQQSRVCVVEMSNLKGVCGVTRWEGESNENVYERCSMGACASGVKCAVMEWLKRNTLRCFGHIEMVNSEEFVKKVYVSEIDGPGRRRRPLGIWKDRVKEYMSERGATRGGGLEQARRKRLDREMWRLLCCDHPLGDVPRGSKALELYIDR